MLGQGIVHVSIVLHMFVQCTEVGLHVCVVGTVYTVCIDRPSFPIILNGNITRYIHVTVHADTCST